MEYIKKEELIEGEIYKVQEGSFSMIGLITLVDNGNNDLYSKRGNATYITTKNEFRKDSCWCYISTNRNIIKATLEEKHWLNTCITADKFITFDEAMKTFIPEYIECIKLYEEFIIGKIYELNKDLWSTGFYVGNVYNSYFKPSTKEAYDAQFVVKIIKPLPQFKVIETIETIETITKVENNEGNQFFIGDTVKSHLNQIGTITDFKYNKDKTDIIAITTRFPVSGISINKIEHYIEPKTNYEILEYKTEGGISCKAPFLQDSHQFYINERCKIYSIKRISDNLIITVGDDVLSKTCGVPNKILSIELINNKIRLYPRNSFYNLEDILKINNK